MTIYTCIIGAYEELKEPLIVTPGWRYVCFTDQPLRSDIWYIKKVESNGNNSRTAREIKILFHKYIKDKYSIYVDGSFQINCNLTDWWNTRFMKPFTVINHPMRSCVYKEAEYCKQSARGNVNQINKQIADYYKRKIPAGKYLIQSGILMRERTKEVIDFCELWHDELSKGSTRDQISFVAAAYQMPIHNLTHWNYRNQNEFIYTKHYKYRR